MTEEQKAEKGAIIPAGLVNLRKIFYNVIIWLFGYNNYCSYVENTCYMNATVECFRHMTDLRDDLKKLHGGLGGDSQAVSFAMSFRDMLNSVDR